MDTTTAISLISGPFLSLLVSFILAKGFRNDVAVALVGAVCVSFAAVVTVLGDAVITGDAHGPLAVAKLVILNIVAVLGTAYSFYEHISKPTGLSDFLNGKGPQSVGSSA